MNYKTSELRLGKNDTPLDDPRVGEVAMRIDSTGAIFTKPEGAEEVAVGSGATNYTPAFASIHNHDTLVSQSIPTGTSYTKLTHFTDNGLALNCTPDVANDKITITEPGHYTVAGSFNFFCSINNVTWRLTPFVGGAEFEEIHLMRKIGTAADVGSASLVGIISVPSAPIDLDVRARHDNGGAVSVTIEYSNLTIHKIAPI